LAKLFPARLHGFIPLFVVAGARISPASPAPARYRGRYTSFEWRRRITPWASVRHRGLSYAFEPRRPPHAARSPSQASRFVVDTDAIQTLIELGSLDPSRPDDRDAVTGVVTDLVTRALAMRIRST
jgi:hypothetical protein